MAKRYILQRMVRDGSRFVDVTGYPDGTKIAFNTEAKAKSAVKQYAKSENDQRERDGRRWEGPSACFSYRIEDA